VRPILPSITLMVRRAAIPQGRHVVVRRYLISWRATSTPGVRRVRLRVQSAPCTIAKHKL
jgi:hypothetical protein